MQLAAREPVALPLEALGNFVRLCQENSQAIGHRLLGEKSGFVKGYVECNLAVVVQCRIVGDSVGSVTVGARAAEVIIRCSGVS